MEQAQVREDRAHRGRVLQQVDDRYEGNLTPEKVDRILEGLK